MLQNSKIDLGKALDIFIFFCKNANKFGHIKKK